MSEEVKNCLMDCVCLIKKEDWAVAQRDQILAKTENLIKDNDH
jgi:hypothetical protein